MKSGNHILLVLLLAVFIYCISAAVNGLSVCDAVLRGLLPYAALYFAAMLLWQSGKWGRLLLFLAVCTWSCQEACLGLSQVFGHRASGHAFFSMTGSFSNPGPYGGFIAMTAAAATAFVIKYRTSFSFSYIRSSVTNTVAGIRSRRHFFHTEWLLFRFLPLAASAVTSVLCLLVLPATMSRAAWLAYAAALLAVICRETGLSEIAGKHKAATLSAVFAMIVLSAGIFMMKKDSAIGRIHIWNMELRAVSEAPLTGTGPGTAMGAYGRAQADYFRSGSRPEAIIRVAGCPEYAFNEYLKAGMETGVAGMLMVIAIVVIAVRNMLLRGNVFGYGLIAAAVFAFFSYPLSVFQTAALVTVFLGTASSGGSGNRIIFPLSALAAVLCMLFVMKDSYTQDRAARKTWQTAAQWISLDLDEDAAMELAGIYEELSGDYRYLYDYGYALHKAGRHEESNKVLSKGAEISSDPMFHNIMGKNHEALGQSGKAAQEYMTSHYMVPCRLYPLVLLLEMYVRTGMETEAMGVRDKILSMPVNPANRTMVDLRRKVETMQLAEDGY